MSRLWWGIVVVVSVFFCFLFPVFLILFFDALRAREFWAIQVFYWSFIFSFISFFVAFVVGGSILFYRIRENL